MRIITGLVKNIQYTNAHIYLDQKQKAVYTFFTFFTPFFSPSLALCVYLARAPPPAQASYSSNCLLLVILYFFPHHIFHSIWCIESGILFFLHWYPIFPSRVLLFICIQRIHLYPLLLTKHKGKKRWVREKRLRNIIVGENLFDKYWPNWIASICTL